MIPHRVWLIQDLIEKNKRIFKIPVYQRNYDWTDVQCVKLFDDILSAFNNDKKHFTGSIVYIKGEYSYSGLDEDMVIDGQQRITTIFLLLKAIYDIANDLQEIRRIEELKDYLYNRRCEQEFKLKLKPIKADDAQFKALMENDWDALLPESNIFKNYRLFVKLITKQLNTGLLLGDILQGMKKLEIIEIILEKSQGDDPQTIFESINSTGLDLSLADLVRNYVLMSDERQEYLYEKYWQKLEEILSTENLADYIITFLNFKLSENITQSNAYIKFKELFHNNKYTNESMLTELLHYSKYQALFIGKSNSYSTEINSIMQDFRNMDQSTIYIFLYSLFDDYSGGTINETLLLQILTFFKGYCVRRIICEIPSNSLRGLFKTLYRRLFSDNKEHFYEKIYSFFKTLRSKDKMPDELEFKQKLLTGNLYNKKKICKYLLASIENYQSNEKIDVNNLTIEHILPQKQNSNIWVEEIGDNYLEVFSNYLHTLGNLTITGYNSELGTKKFSEKKAIIKEYSKANRLNKDILSEDRWTEDAIKNRAKNLSEYILKIFSYFIPPEVNLALENDEKLFLADMEVVTGKKPSSVSLCGNITSVDSFTEMLGVVIKELSALDIKLMGKLAEENYKITFADRTYISYDDKLLRRPKELGDTGIYYESNLSAKNILQFIKELLDIYALDQDDLFFTLQDEVV